MKRTWLTIIFLFVPTFTQAALIEFTATKLGEQSYELMYDITNNDFANGIEEFSIYFDVLEFSNISVVANYSDWDVVAVQGDSFFGDDGFVDALTFTSPLKFGVSLPDFMRVTLDCIVCSFGSGHSFDILDPNDFSVLASGVSILKADTSPVPTPNTLALLFLSLIFLSLRRSPTKLD